MTKAATETMKLTPAERLHKIVNGSYKKGERRECVIVSKKNKPSCEIRPSTFKSSQCRNLNLSMENVTGKAKSLLGTHKMFSKTLKNKNKKKTESGKFLWKQRKFSTSM